MKAFRQCVAAMAVLAALVLAGRAGDFYVAPDGSDAEGWGGNWAQPYATIGHAVAQAEGTGPHTVYVSNGTPYLISSEIVLTNNILVRSWNNGTLDEAETIVDGQSMMRGFKLTHADAVLAGFTVRNGTNETAGGGVYVTGGGTVTQCVLSANSAREGGGICITNGGLVTHSTLSGNVAVSNAALSSPGGGAVVWKYGVISNCVVADNTVASKRGGSGGGGIALDVSATNHEMRVYGTLVSNNVSEWQGGGIIIRQTLGGVTQAVISGSTVASNFSGQMGGGIMLYRAWTSLLMGTITGCVIKGNYAVGGNDGCAAGIGYSTLVRNCTISGNSAQSKGAGGYSVTIFDSLVESNCSLGGAGAGLYYAHGGHVVSNCVIRGNTAEGSLSSGGAIVVPTAGLALEIRDCEIRDNLAGRGPGLQTVATSTGLLYNCLVCDNVTTTFTYDSRSILYGVFALSGCTIVSNVAGNATHAAVNLFAGSSMTNCIVYSNKVAGSYGNDVKYAAGVEANISYSCAPGNLPAGQGNITEPPTFQDFAGGDYRPASDSPTVNAGTNEPWMDGARDLAGRTRIDPFSLRADMGAYEFLPAGALFRLR